MKTQRFVCMAAMLGVLVSSGLATAQAQKWPTKPVRIVTGWSPGGNADAISRLLAEDWVKRTADAIVVDNRPGAAGTIGAQIVVRAPADGHTILVASMSEVTVVPPMSVKTMG